jgi:hypothetical protein
MKLFCYFFGHKYTGPYGIINKRMFITAFPGYNVILPYCWRCGCNNPNYEKQITENNAEIKF